MTTASIGSSLFQAGQAAGLSDPLIMRLMQIFRWDIDFALDIHKGDRFAVIYEELSRDGKTIKQGEILAAEFKSRGKSYRAVRFVDAQGRTDYYSQRGDALDKAFIRTPVQPHQLAFQPAPPTPDPPHPARPQRGGLCCTPWHPGQVLP
jgi:hypothetical protein